MKKQTSSVIEKFRIVNVVSSTRAKRPIDIEKLATHLNTIQYEPGMFPGLIYRRTNPKTTLTIFSTGKIVSTGAKSEQEARNSIFLTLPEIVAIEEKEIEIEQIKTENIVAISHTGFKIDLDGLSKSGLPLIYKPSVFPGAIYEVREKVKLLVFKSGKLVLAGSKSTYDAKKNMKTALKNLRKYEEVT